MSTSEVMLNARSLAGELDAALTAWRAVAYDPAVARELREDAAIKVRLVEAVRLFIGPLEGPEMTRVRPFGEQLAVSADEYFSHLAHLLTQFLPRLAAHRAVDANGLPARAMRSYTQISTELLEMGARHPLPPACKGLEESAMSTAEIMEGDETVSVEYVDGASVSTPVLSGVVDQAPAAVLGAEHACGHFEDVAVGCVHAALDPRQDSGIVDGVDDVAAQDGVDDVAVRALLAEPDADRDATVGSDLGGQGEPERLGECIDEGCGVVDEVPDGAGLVAGDAGLEDAVMAREISLVGSKTLVEVELNRVAERVSSHLRDTFYRMQVLEQVTDGLRVTTCDERELRLHLADCIEQVSTGVCQDVFDIDAFIERFVKSMKMLLKLSTDGAVLTDHLYSCDCHFRPRRRCCGAAAPSQSHEARGAGA